MSRKNTNKEFTFPFPPFNSEPGGTIFSFRGGIIPFQFIISLASLYLGSKFFSDSGWGIFFKLIAIIFFINTIRGIFWWQNEKENTSLSSFIDIHLIEAFHEIRALIMKVWSDSRLYEDPPGAPELRKNDEDLNYAVIALFEPILHTSFGITEYAVGKIIFHTKIMELGKEEKWCNTDKLTNFVKRVDVYEDLITNMEKDDPVEVITNALAKKKGTRDGFENLLCLPIGSAYFDIGKQVINTAKKDIFEFQHSEDQIYLTDNPYSKNEDSINSKPT